jgi:hypothetical protein
MDFCEFEWKGPYYVECGTHEGFWSEAAKWTMDIENMLVTPNIPVAAYHQFYGITEWEIKFYKPFGDMAIVEENQHRKI